MTSMMHSCTQAGLQQQQHHQRSGVWSFCGHRLLPNDECRYIPFRLTSHFSLHTNNIEGKFASGLTSFRALFGHLWTLLYRIPPTVRR